MRKLYWWDTRPNLGDLLTPMLFEHYGIDYEWAPPDQAEWVGIGSVLGWFDGFTGTVFGSGRGGDQLPVHDLTRANVLALRGKLTQELVKGGDDAVLGDPGLLLGDLVHDFRTEHEAVIVPHFDDQERMRSTYLDAVIVDVTGDPWEALSQIARANRVISSSLHGLVLADTFGKPRFWDPAPMTQGKGFKFRDYASVVGKFEPNRWVQVNHDKVVGVKKELKEALQSVDPDERGRGKKERND